MHRDAFAGLAVLPSEGSEAAGELVRCVVRYGFVGGVMGVGRKRMDGDETEAEEGGKGWEEVWNIAEKYRVPILWRSKWPIGNEVCFQSLLLIFLTVFCSGGWNGGRS
jgi:predicted TIM-barrel fold metal-dependent hydrolase